MPGARNQRKVWVHWSRIHSNCGYQIKIYLHLFAPDQAKMMVGKMLYPSKMPPSNNRFCLQNPGNEGWKWSQIRSKRCIQILIYSPVIFPNRRKKTAKRRSKSGKKAISNKYFFIYFSPKSRIWRAKNSAKFVQKGIVKLYFICMRLPRNQAKRWVKSVQNSDKTAPSNRVSFIYHASKIFEKRGWIGVKFTQNDAIKLESIYMSCGPNDSKRRLKRKLNPLKAPIFLR